MRTGSDELALQRLESFPRLSRGYSSSPALDAKRYTPKLWEKWIHAAYFGHVYYWIKGLKVVSYHYEPSFKAVPKQSWYAQNGKKTTGGGYSRKSKHDRTPVRGKTLNLVTDFAPKQRYWWEGDGLKVPDAKLFIEPSFGI